VRDQRRNEKYSGLGKNGKITGHKKVVGEPQFSSRRMPNEKVEIIPRQREILPKPIYLEEFVHKERLADSWKHLAHYSTNRVEWGHLELLSDVVPNTDARSMWYFY